MGSRLFLWIYQQDVKIMKFIHLRFNNTKLKPIMSFFSHPPGWRQLIFLSMLLLFIVGARQTRLRIVLLLLAILVSDQTCNLLKVIFKRVRPDGICHPQGNFWQKLGQYSLPSSHAANNFCLAVLVSHWVPYSGAPLYIWAFLVAFSRICLKNHYPLDVFVGALIGIGYGLISLNIPWIV